MHLFRIIRRYTATKRAHVIEWNWTINSTRSANNHQNTTTTAADRKKQQNSATKIITLNMTNVWQCVKRLNDNRLHAEIPIQSVASNGAVAAVAAPPGADCFFSLFTVAFQSLQRLQSSQRSLHIKFYVFWLLVTLHQTCHESYLQCGVPLIRTPQSVCNEWAANFWCSRPRMACILCRMWSCGFSRPHRGALPLETKRRCCKWAKSASIT